MATDYVYRRPFDYRWQMPTIIFPREAELVVVPETVGVDDRFHYLPPVRQWQFLYPTVFAPPEIVAYFPELPEGDECYLRRAELDDQCRRRGELEPVRLRRAPECPTEFACPNTGCT